MSDKVRFFVISGAEFSRIGNFLTGEGGAPLGGDALTLHNVLREGWKVTAMTALEGHIYLSVYKQVQ